MILWFSDHPALSQAQLLRGPADVSLPRLKTPTDTTELIGDTQNSQACKNGVITKSTEHNMRSHTPCYPRPGKHSIHPTRNEVLVNMLTGTRAGPCCDVSPTWAAAACMFNGCDGRLRGKASFPCYLLPLNIPNDKFWNANQIFFSETSLDTSLSCIIIESCQNSRVAKLSHRHAEV